MLGTVAGANSPARGRIRERFLLRTALVLFLAKNVEGESIHVEALKTGHRFNTSAYVDSYFSCNVCGGGIQWLVNGQDAGGHLSSHTAGSVSSEFEIQDNTALRYTSILLSVRSNCLDIVLIVSQIENDFYDNPPQVTCRGSTQQQEVPVKMPIQQFVPEIINGAVTLTRVLGRSDIISLNSNSYFTHIYVCSTTESTQFWRHNQSPAGGFNELNYPGFHEFTLLSSDPSIASQEAVLLVKRPQVDLTSVLLLTDVYSNLNFTVLCGSNTNYAYLNISIKKELRGNSTTTSSDTETNTTSEEIVEPYNYSDDVTETYNYSDDVNETESTTICNARSRHYIAIGIIFIFISITCIVVIIITVILCLLRHKQCTWRIQQTTSHSKNLSDMECELQHITSHKMPKIDMTTGLDKKMFISQ